MKQKPEITAEKALQRLIDGNNRFLAGKLRMTAPTVETMSRLSRGQQPFATILGCSDSRVPPEWIFDAGLGELFVVRVAGNILSPEVAGSLQYAGSHLCTPLFVVLGHEGCGAVQAAMETKFKGIRQRSRIQLLVEGIIPALKGVDQRLPLRKQLEQAVENNVRFTVRRVLESPEGRARTEEGRMKIVGAIYEIRTGRVRFLDVLSGQEAGSPERSVAKPRISAVKRAGKQSGGGALR